MALVCLFGCNEVYGLDETRGLPDVDGDRIEDAKDNCPRKDNADQNDEDGDGRGDVCDQCPLVVDKDGDDFDKDGIGDACDPHPDNDRDCVVLVDTFRDPSILDDEWQVTGGGFEARDGDLVLHPNAELGSKTVSGLIDLQIIGAMDIESLDTPATSAVVAIVNRGAQLGHTCTLDSRAPTSTTDAPAILVQGFGGPPSQFKALVPSVSVGREFTIRMLTLRTMINTTPGTAVGCRAELGIAIGADLTGGALINAAPMAILAQRADVLIRSVAVSILRKDGEACPDVRYR